MNEAKGLDKKRLQGGLEMASILSDLANFFVWIRLYPVVTRNGIKSLWIR